ncbi:MAG: hypothetical protein A2107_15790 [Verrucomicrobia bacterium GWF2_62_7]|nr:MAG: hypothetical protein A2107_15790 [Verrucomicrobia bacterium GWF2_62_7]
MLKVWRGKLKIWRPLGKVWENLGKVWETLLIPRQVLLKILKNLSKTFGIQSKARRAKSMIMRWKQGSCAAGL